MFRFVPLFLVAACVESRELELSGPLEVTVDALGPVAGPEARLDDGSEPDGLEWSTDDADVLAVGSDGAVVAIGRGEAQVIGTWAGQEVAWTVVVEPRVQLRVRGPDHVLRVGDRLRLDVDALSDGARVNPGPLQWRTSNADVVRLDAHGALVAVGAGLAFVTVTSVSGRAVAEVEVR